MCRRRRWPASPDLGPLVHTSYSVTFKRTKQESANLSGTMICLPVPHFSKHNLLIKYFFFFFFFFFFQLCFWTFDKRKIASFLMTSTSLPITSKIYPTLPLYTQQYHWTNRVVKYFIPISRNKNYLKKKNWLFNKICGLVIKKCALVSETSNVCVDLSRLDVETEEISTNFKSVSRAIQACNRIFLLLHSVAGKRLKLQ